MSLKIHKGKGQFGKYYRNTVHCHCADGGDGSTVLVGGPCDLRSKSTLQLHEQHAARLRGNEPLAASTEDFGSKETL